MNYVDGYVLAVPKKKLKVYKKMARVGAKVWMDHGALDYKECVGEDMNVKWGVPFPKAFKAKPGEVMIFAFVVYKSRAHRDKVNAKVMTDKRLMDSMKDTPMPFDMKRMVYGGFEVLVEG